MTRGPKPRTASNAAPRHKELIRHETFESPSPLSKTARAEYDRLLGVLRDKGTLDRVDLAVVAECARAKAALDSLYKLDPDLAERGSVAKMGILTSQRRGLLRELGLTSRPHLSVVKTNPVPAEDDPIAGKIKLMGG